MVIKSSGKRRKLADMDDAEKRNAIIKYKAGHRDALEDIDFRLYLLEDLTAKYIIIKNKMGNLLPSKQDSLAIKKDLYAMLIDMHSDIKKHVNAIIMNADNINFYADQLNTYGAAKTKSMHGDKSVKTALLHYPSVPYETIDKNKIFKTKDQKRENIIQKGNNKKPESTNEDITGVASQYVAPNEYLDVYTIPLPPHEVGFKGEETDRKNKSSKKRGRPAKREVVNGTSAKQFGTRIIKNATKLSGTSKITRKVNK